MFLEKKSVSVRTSGGKQTSLPFLALKNAVLGGKYELSVAFVGEKESRRLNRLYRKKHKPADILSFPLSKNSGEIIICPAAAEKTSRRFSYSKRDFIPFLFIHGLFHLKGFLHGSKMESKEAAVRKKFGVKERPR